MLKRLSVKNFALIENAQLELNKGFTVITGETGSGKSILLGALKLILGERADYTVIRDETKKTIVEAIFVIDDKLYADFFKTNDLDVESETIIRREINAKGKSRAFINDTPVQLNVLKSLASRLIHIHSQHHTLSLKDTQFQMSILDVLGDNQKSLKSLKSVFNERKALIKEIKRLEENKSKIELEHDFNSFQLEELSKLNLTSVDYEKIEQEVERGEQFEEIKSAYQSISHLVNNDDEGVISILNRLVKSANVNDTKVQSLIERIQSVKLELDDIAANAEDDLSEMTLAPETLNEYIHQMDAFNSALRKHNLNTQSELLELYESLSKEVEDSGQIDERIIELNQELTEVNKKALQFADKLSTSRKKVAKKLEKEVAELLNQLKLEGATIRFDLNTVELNELGTDSVALYFAPNKGMTPKVIEKSASGGELSRLMLVIQYLLSEKQQLPTVIFDEIDTGVSGEVAQKIGDHLKRMGERMQLLAITHLPQVASKGSDHILVEKNDEHGITKTYLRRLTEEDRVEEIAKLMSGSKINEAALMNAKNLMNE
ncbi:DNA repair protein RecN [Brumimicrobium aurantiacum]|uniref:DNA repair protein RecN n=1 Tax=Brumimicrobium aurantiacum TaxID=1737063 RepID=A0A3E1EZA0_9FLAO|nr:DNA repair protein RecN [Brumimicrobium aurantiacum]RFC54899.1 DNA repair protein RecN [Brumimicrobium aurantiacum]